MSSQVDLSNPFVVQHGANFECGGEICAGEIEGGERRSDNRAVMTDGALRGGRDTLYARLNSGDEPQWQCSEDAAPEHDGDI